MSKKENTPEYLYPKNDFIFKRLFGSEGNEDITKNLISNIIGYEIKSLQLKNPYLLREHNEDKEEILDIKAMLNEDIQCDIEIQVGNNHDVEKRLLDSWSKMYRQSIGKGKEYKDMKKTIIIFITLFDVDNLKMIREYKTKWCILEEKLNIKLTDVFEVDIIELSKVKKQLKSGTLDAPKDLKNWLTFLINPKELEGGTKMEEMSEEVKKAYELWQSLNLNEEEREIAEKRYLDLISFEHAKEYEKELGRKEGFEEGKVEGMEKGLAEGREEGKAEGKEEGRKEEKIEVAKKMLSEDIDISVIIKVTSLSREEIESLK